MKHRGWTRLALSFLTCSMALTIATSTAFAQQQDQQEQFRKQAQVSSPSEAQIWKMIIQDSIASDPHLCPCPYSANRAGRACGTRSAYSRVAGSLICYPQDIPDEQIARYRERLQ
jgi:hypothetical protein